MRATVEANVVPGPWSGPSGTIVSMGVLERDSFLAQLDDLLGEAAWRGGRLVLVRGEAGIGKSTLVQAFSAGRSGRVLWGTCDPVAPPRPLAPIVDMAQQVGGDLRTALEEEDRQRVSAAFLELVRADGGPWVAVLEDMQWADDATLELLKVVGRRVAQIPALVVVTFRDDEVGPDHPLSATLGDIPAASMVSLQLPALSVSAVEELATGTGIDPSALHDAAQGNPFFVTEVLASGGRELPSTVRDAVWARARRLTPDALAVLRAAAVLGPRCDVEVLGRVAVSKPEHIDECISHGMLRRDRSIVEFRHELARRGVLDSMSGPQRRDLHAQSLTVLSERPGAVELSELANHAAESEDAEAVLSLAPRAAAQAAALGAHRAARAQYENALRYLGRLSVAARAPLLAAHGHECYLTDDLKRAISSQEEAVACWRDVGEVDDEGRALSDLALMYFWNGQSERARTTSAAAVELLESITPGSNLALAYARLAQLWMMVRNFQQAVELGERALALGDQLSEESVVVHVLNTIGTAEACLGSDEGFEKIEESLRRARAADLEEDIGRALNNLMAVARETRRYDRFDRYAAENEVFMEERDLEAQRRCLVGDIAEAAMERGRWDEAVACAKATVDAGWRNGRVQSLWVLGRVTARRGESGVFWFLDEASSTADPGSSDEFVLALSAVRAEAAWLGGESNRALAEATRGLQLAHGDQNPWHRGDAAFWARKADPSFAPPPDVAEPYALYFAGYPDKAAAAWVSIGCPYEEAMALMDCDDEADVRQALHIFQTLGAVPAAAMATDRLRAMGARHISRGPRGSTRANPAGLSNREVEVLLLVADGLRNAEIAERLTLSTKTVDHHVSSVLAKLGARDRYDAGRRAIVLGLAK
jgi:DNA-binding CsgD family transcriptional regulator/tetratricopeptide (TPR) repeat protein